MSWADSHVVRLTRQPGSRSSITFFPTEATERWLYLLENYVKLRCLEVIGGNQRRKVN